MKIQVTGIVEDGTPRRPGVPVNPRRALNVARGIDLQLSVRVITPLGIPVSLEGDGTELLLTVKKRPQEHPPRIVLAASLNGNVGIFSIQPGDTRRLQPGLFSWDVWLTRNGLRDPVIPLSPFNLQAANAAVPAQPPPEVVNIYAGDTDPLVLDFSPLDITGWTVELLVGTEPTPTTLVATIPIGTDGLSYVDVSTLPVGQFATQVRRTNLIPEQKTSDVFILNVLQPVVP